MTSERRREPRFLVDVEVVVDPDGVGLRGRLHDISRDAALVETARAWPLGSELELAFTLPGSGRALRLRGPVVRLAAGDRFPHAGAVVFTDPPPAAATEIDLFIARQGGDQAGG